LLGPNGAGKSTLVRLLMGAAKPWAGRVSIDATPVRSLDARARARRIALVSQRPDIAAAFSVREVVALGCYAFGHHAGPIERALERMSLDAHADTPFAQLSVGQQQRVTIARAVAQLDSMERPGVLLADEPFSAMDPAHAAHAAGMIRELGAGGVAVLLVLHDFAMARRLADSAIVLDRLGAVASEGPGREVLVPTILERTFDVAFDECATPEGTVLVAGTRAAGPGRSTGEGSV
jgi:iron complex transport system ATP-binding protein